MRAPLIAGAAAILAACGGRGGPADGGSAIPLEETMLLSRVAEHPDDVEARLSLANRYYDTDRPHRAIPHYEEVLRHRPGDPDVRTDLGTCYKNIGDLDRAAAEYEAVLAEHPRHVQATFNLGVVSSLAGHYARAADFWERAAALVPGTDLAGHALRYAAAARRQTATTQPKESP